VKLPRLWMLSLACLLLGAVVGCGTDPGSGGGGDDDDDTALGACSGDYVLASAEYEAGALAVWPGAQVLTDIIDIAACEVIEGSLGLWGTSLATVDGLSNLTSVGGDLLIHDNPALCQSFIDAFIAACTICGVVQNIC